MLPIWSKVHLEDLLVICQSTSTPWNLTCKNVVSKFRSVSRTTAIFSALRPIPGQLLNSKLPEVGFDTYLDSPFLAFRLGCPDFTYPPANATPKSGASRSLFYPEEAINGSHPRFKSVLDFGII